MTKYTTHSRQEYYRIMNLTSNDRLFLYNYQRADAYDMDYYCTVKSTTRITDDPLITINACQYLNNKSIRIRII